MPIKLFGMELIESRQIERGKDVDEGRGVKRETVR